MSATEPTHLLLSPIHRITRTRPAVALLLEEDEDEPTPAVPAAPVDEQKAQKEATKQPQKCHTPPQKPLPPPPPTTTSSPLPLQLRTEPALSVSIACPDDVPKDESTTAPPSSGSGSSNSNNKVMPRRKRLQRQHYQTMCFRHTPPSLPPPLPPSASSATGSPLIASASQQSPEQRRLSRCQHTAQSSQLPLLSSPPFSFTSSMSASSSLATLPPPPPPPPSSSSTITTTTTTSSSSSSSFHARSHILARTVSEYGLIDDDDNDESNNNNNNNNSNINCGNNLSAKSSVPRLQLTESGTSGSGSGSTRGSSERSRLCSSSRSNSVLDMSALTATLGGNSNDSGNNSSVPGKVSHSARLHARTDGDLLDEHRSSSNSSNNIGKAQTAAQSTKTSEASTPRKFGSLMKFFTIHSPDKAGTGSGSGSGSNSSSSSGGSPRKNLFRTVKKLRGGEGDKDRDRDRDRDRQQHHQQAQPPSMLTMLFTPALRESFRVFLVGRFAEENLLFVEECGRFADRDFAGPTAQEDLTKEARRIYDTYVRAGAELEVNIGHEQRRPLEEALFSPSQPLLPISQAVFEELSLDIRNFMEVTFLPAWLAAGAWRTISYEPYAPNLPSLPQVLRSRRMRNQFFLYVSSHGGAHLVDFLAACDAFAAAPSVDAFAKAAALGKEFFPKPMAAAATTDGSGDGENGDPQLLEVTRMDTCIRLVGDARRAVCKVLETKYYLDWVVRKTWTSVYIPCTQDQFKPLPHHNINDNSTSNKK